MALLPFAGLISGCYKEYLLEVEAKPVLCINSLVTAGEPIEVSVSRSWVYTDAAGEGNHSVDDATVILYANGRQVSEDYLPREGDEIRIVAMSKRYGEAEATVKVPRAPLLENMEYVPVSARYGWYKNEENLVYLDFGFNLRVRITIVDSTEETDYYRFDMIPYGFFGGYGEDQCPMFTLWGGDLDYSSEPIFGEHVSELDAVMGPFTEGFPFFTDRQFSGKDYRLNLRYTNGYAVFHGFPAEIDEIGDAGFIIEVSSISESYYKWNYYCWQYNYGYIFDFADIGLSDQIPGYSNVSTGAGVVAARSIARIRVPLEGFIFGQFKEIIKKLEEE